MVNGQASLPSFVVSLFLDESQDYSWDSFEQVLSVSSCNENLLTYLSIILVSQIPEAYCITVTSAENTPEEEMFSMAILFQVKRSL